MLHVHYHIDRKAADHYAARFKVHRGSDSESFLPSVALEQAFADRQTAHHALVRAIEAHMARRYNLRPDEFAVEEG